MMRRTALLLALLAPLAACAPGALSRPDLFGPRVPADEALSEADAAVRHGHPQGLARAGWVALLRGGDLEAAVARWQAAVAADPRTPLAWVGLAEHARARLDDAGARRAWLALLETTPDHPLAELAAGRLEDALPDVADADLEARMRARLADPELTPRARPLLRAALAGHLADTGRLAEARALETLDGPEAWTVVGPFSRFRALERDVPFGPEREGRLAARYDGPLSPLAPRRIAVAEGDLELEGEPRDGDVYLAVADVTVPEGGEHLLRWETQADLRLTVDGVPVAVRDELTAVSPEAGWAGVDLDAGTHRVVARIVRGGGRVDLKVALLDRAGRPAGTWAAAAPGTDAPGGRAEATGPEPGLAEWAEARLEDDPDDALTAFLDALDHGDVDVERVRRRLETVFAAAPELPFARDLEARVNLRDPALPASLRTARAIQSEARAVAADPRHAAGHAVLAALALRQDRWDAAATHLDAAAEVAPGAPEVARLQAKLARARGGEVLARRILEAAADAGATDCRLREELFEARRDDDDLAGADAAADRVKGCGARGLALWADLRARRGDLAAALEGYAALQAAAPSDPAHARRRADLLRDAGRTDEARAVLARDLAAWPRSAEAARALGSLEAAAGRPAEARRWRERALRLDPGDLRLRRALAEGELLDWGAVDLAAAVAAYRAEADGFGAGSDAVMVVDHAAAEVFAEDPARPVVVERIQSAYEVRTKDGIDAQGEVALPADAEVVALHVLKPDGRILEPEEVAGEGRVSMRGLAVGDVVVTDYLVSHGPRAETLPGWTAGPFFFGVFDLPLYRSSYAVRAPASVGLEVSAGNLDPPPVRREGDHLVFRYEVRRRPPVPAEPDTPDPEEFLPWVRAGAGAGPLARGEAWGDYAVDRALPTYEVRRFAEAAMAGLSPAERADPEALARALAAAVDRHVRGDADSGRLTDTGAHALARGRGNRLLATRAVLAAAGLDSHVALVRPFSAPAGVHRFPDPGLHTYGVLVVELGEGRRLWLDQNRRTAPLGHLRPVHADRPALLLAEPGRPAEIVRTPAMDSVVDEKAVEIRLTLSPEGDLVAEGAERYTGYAAAVVREALATVSAERRRQVVEAGLAQSLGPLALTDLAFEGDAEDAAPGTPLTIRYQVSAPGWARADGDRLVAPGGTLFPADLSRRLIQRARRETPLLLDSEHRQSLSATFVLPEGYRLAAAGDPLVVEGPFGRFERRVGAEGREVTVSEVLDLALTRVPPEAYGDLARFAARVDAGQARELVFRDEPAS